MMGAINKGTDVGLLEHKRGGLTSQKREEGGEGRLFKQVLPSKWLLRNVQEFKRRSSRERKCKATEVIL